MRIDLGQNINSERLEERHDVAVRRIQHLVVVAWQVDELPGDYYRMQNVDGDDIGLLLKAFGLEIPAKIYTNGDIRELKSSVNPF